MSVKKDALPRRIQPNPLVTSAVELRFNSEIEASRLFSLIFPKIQEELPKFEQSKVPVEFRKHLFETQGHITPDYVFSNDFYSVSFGDRNLIFENVNEYQFWDNYFPFISKVLGYFFDLNVFKTVSRVGVRYASVYSNVQGMKDVILSVPSLGISGYNEEVAFVRVDIKEGDIAHHLQIANSAKAQKGGRTLSGVYLDIDSAYNGELAGPEAILGTIDRLHDSGKYLVFKRILNEAFIKSLNPEY